MRKLVENDDYSAFMTVSDVSEIVGKHIKSRSAIPELTEDTEVAPDVLDEKQQM